MFEHVLVPHDLTEFADRALGPLHALRPSIGRLHVVHVLPRLDPQHPGVVWPRDEDELRRAHATRQLQERVAGTDLADAICHVVIGDPASRIVVLARQLGITLVVIPSHGRNGLSRLFLGSVAEQVTRFAPCPVLVLPASMPEDTPHAPPPLDLVGKPREVQVDRLGSQITVRVAEADGYLTAARILIPTDEDPTWWRTALEQRLSAAGIDFVDLFFVPGPTPHGEILSCTFEEQWAD